MNIYHTVIIHPDYLMLVDIMSIIDLKLGGLVGLSIGTLAVAAYAGFVGAIVVEGLGVLLSAASAFVYIGIQVDRYYQER